MKRKNIIGIDFLKAIAIISIIIYHINVKILPGGFIGVDLFFVISGYLLANSLIKQVNKDGKVKYFDNIKKRIKTLWPLLFIVVFVVTIYITLFNKQILDVSHKDVIPALGFMSNWWLIFNNVGYFDSFIANPFKHLWYISVLVQSYIIIISLFKLSYSITQNKKFPLFKVMMIGVVLISFTLSQVLYDPQNVSRVYYGTDTRIYTIAIGVLGYFIFPIDKLEKTKTIDRKNKRKIAKTKEISTLVSVVTLALYIYAILNIYEFYGWIYRVGFLLFAINSLFLLLSFGNENNYLYNIIRFVPIGLFGKMSYSLYLWHYPLILLTMTNKESNGPNLLYTIIRVFVIIFISLITYNLIEQKSSAKFDNRHDRRARQKRREKFNILNYKIAIPFILIFFLGVFGIAMPYTSTAFLKKSTNIAQTDGEKIETLENTQNENNKINPNFDRNDPNTIILDGNEKESVKEETTQSEYNSEIANESERKIKYSQLVLVGDSLAVNVGNRLQELYPNAIVDAKISRQLINSKDVVASYSRYDSKDTALIIMLGTNGYFTKSDLEELISTFPNSKKVFVNIKTQEAWETSVNEIYQEFVQENPDMSLIDWHSMAIENPEYLEPDNTHLNFTGVDALIDQFIVELS